MALLLWFSSKSWATAYLHAIHLLKILPRDREATPHVAYVVYGLMNETGISRAPTWSVVRSWTPMRRM
jgi:hypothetical protein